MSQYLQYGSSILASNSLALGCVPAGARYQGQTILDAWQPFLGDYAIVYGRARGPREYSVVVQRFFSTIAAAKAFFLTHEDTLPVQGDLTYVDDVAGAAYTMAGAVCSARMVSHEGVAVTVEYTFTGSRFETDDVPDAPTEGDTVKAINQAIDNGAVYADVAYDVAFASDPRGLNVSITGPDGAAVIGCRIKQSSRTAAGFRVDFEAAIPATGYYLTGMAVL